jgi:hypothetical protein
MLYNERKRRFFCVACKTAGQYVGSSKRTFFDLASPPAFCFLLSLCCFFLCFPRRSFKSRSPSHPLESWARSWGSQGCTPVMRESRFRCEPHCTVVKSANSWATPGIHHCWGRRSWAKRESSSVMWASTPAKWETSGCSWATRASTWAKSHWRDRVQPVMWDCSWAMLGSKKARLGRTKVRWASTTATWATPCCRCCKLVSWASKKVRLVCTPDWRANQRPER